MITGVRTKLLTVRPDERGTLMEILRRDEEIFEDFGQVYVTSCYPGVVKAWHYHKEQTDHFVCLRGTAKVVLFDDRPDSPTNGSINEFYLGLANPILLKIPMNVYHGFTGVGTDEAMILNIPTMPYRPDAPDEYRLAWNDPSIPYDWAVKNG